MHGIGREHCMPSSRCKHAHLAGEQPFTTWASKELYFRLFLLFALPENRQMLLRVQDSIMCGSVQRIHDLYLIRQQITNSYTQGTQGNSEILSGKSIGWGLKCNITVVFIKFCRDNSYKQVQGRKWSSRKWYIQTHPSQPHKKPEKVPIWKENEQAGESSQGYKSFPAEVW